MLGCKFVFEEKILWFYSKSFKPFSFLTLWKLRHSYRLTLPIFSLQPAISRKQKWTHSHILPYFIKALIHTYIHKDRLLSRYHHRFPAFSLSLSLCSHFTKLSKFLCKKKQLCANFLSEQIYLWRWFRFNGLCRAQFT